MKKTYWIAMILLCTLAVASTALAHMAVTKTVPEDGTALSKAPEWVQVWYTQEPREAVSKMSLTGPNGDVSLLVHLGGEMSLMGMVEDKDLPDGEYVVEWQSAGDDGAVQNGEYKFTLKSAN